MPIEKDFKCNRCPRAVKSRSSHEIKPISFSGHPVEIVDDFCYLGDQSAVAVSVVKAQYSE